MPPRMSRRHIDIFFDQFYTHVPYDYDYGSMS